VGSWAKSLVHYSLVRLLIGGLAVVAATLAAQLLINWLGGRLGIRHAPGWVFLTYAASVPTALMAYIGYTRYFERRAATELSIHGAKMHAVIGVILGLLLFCVTLGTVTAFASVAVSTGAGIVAVGSVGIALSSAVSEELVFRALLFRLAERSLGTWPAMGISAVLFGALHLANPGAGLVSTVAITLESGLLLCSAYILTRNLWFAIGLHFGWDVAESALFGATMSGHIDPGLFVTRVGGPSFLSGGSFGVEASIVALLWSLLVTAFLLATAARRGRIQALHFGARD
jgi:membrane protease YdiL (CAAX protease family)